MKLSKTIDFNAHSRIKKKEIKIYFLYATCKKQQMIKIFKTKSKN